MTHVATLTEAIVAGYPVAWPGPRGGAYPVLAGPGFMGTKALRDDRPGPHLSIRDWEIQWRWCTRCETPRAEWSATQEWVHKAIREAQELVQGCKVPWAQRDLLTAEANLATLKAWAAWGWDTPDAIRAAARESVRRHAETDPARPRNTQGVESLMQGVRTAQLAMAGENR